MLVSQLSVGEGTTSNTREKDNVTTIERSSMKLYELARNTEFTIAEWGDKVFLLHRIDGAYSYCTCSDGTVYHIGASTEVIVV
jgi:hypothetical protein